MVELSVSLTDDSSIQTLGCCPMLPATPAVAVPNYHHLLFKALTSSYILNWPPTKTTQPVRVHGDICGVY